MADNRATRKKDALLIRAPPRALPSFANFLLAASIGDSEIRVVSLFRSSKYGRSGVRSSSVVRNRLQAGAMKGGFHGRFTTPRPGL